MVTAFKDLISTINRSLIPFAFFNKAVQPYGAQECDERTRLYKKLRRPHSSATCGAPNWMPN